MAGSDQIPLFEETPPCPGGMLYEDSFLSVAEEQALVAAIAALPFAPFEFHGFEGKRRVVSFGWRYGFDGTGLARTGALPEFVLPFRDRAAAFAGLAPEALQQLLVTEYAPGAGIGWHRDRPVFDETIGISLLAPCRLRFRRRQASGWERMSLIAEPRSIYVLRGPSRTEWEHSIPELDELRYSLTFRSLAKK